MTRRGSPGRPASMPDSSTAPATAGGIQTIPHGRAVPWPLMAAGSADDPPGSADPGSARDLDELVARLRTLKIWAGNPSYDVITRRVNERWAAAGRPANELARRGTVVDCFRSGRRRINADL